MKDLREQIATLIEDATKDSLQSVSVPRPMDAYIEKLLDNAELATWYCKGEMQGLVAFYANDPHCETAFVTMVAVAPEKRRAKIAIALLEAMLMSISARGFHRCSLEVDVRNFGAIALYDSLGFERIGATGDVVTMALKLPWAGSRVVATSEK